MSIIGLILFLIVAAVCAYIAEMLVPGRVPGGFFTSAIVGIIGAWLGTSLMGHLGPDLEGIPLIPCILGSAIFIFILSLVSSMLKGRKTVE